MVFFAVVLSLELTVPETELLEGIMLIIGGALLLTPGFATDTIGFVCLIPGLRRPLAARIIRSTAFGNFHFHTQFSPRDPFNNSSGLTIDGQFEAESESESESGTKSETKSVTESGIEDKRSDEP